MAPPIFGICATNLPVSPPTILKTPLTNLPKGVKNKTAAPNKVGHQSLKNL